MKADSYIKLCVSFVAIVVCFSSCEDEYDPKKQAAKDEKKILDYIEENELDAERHPSGLYYVIEVEGSGSHPTSESVVNVNYKGYFLDGEVFANGNGVNLYLSNSIEGLQIGVPLFSRGGKGILLIPSALGHGGSYDPFYWGYSSSVNKVLVYDIEIIDFN